MAAAAPLHIPLSPPEVAAAEFAGRNAPLSATLGMTPSELAAVTAEVVTLPEAEQRGWISPEERRLYEGEATLADLLTLGYGEAEAQAILDEQREDRACASSS